MKKRIIALLLCFAMCVSMVGCVGRAIVPQNLTGNEEIVTEATPTPVVSEEPEVTDEPEVTVTPTPEVTVTPTPEATATPTPEVTVTPTPEATEEPVVTETPAPTVTPTPTPEAIMPINEGDETVDNCAYCEETTAEDGTVTHADGCNTLYEYNGEADIGKYVVLNEAAGPYYSVSYDTTFEDLFTYEYADFEEGQIFEITGYYYQVDTTGSWYLVKAYTGTMPEDTPEEIYILQNYEKDGYEDDSLTFVTVEEPEEPTYNEVTDHASIGEIGKFAATSTLYKEIASTETKTSDGLGVSYFTIEKVYVNSADETDLWYYINHANWPTDYADYHYVKASDVTITGDAALQPTYESLMAAGCLAEFEELMAALDEATKTALEASVFWQEILEENYHLVYSYFYSVGTEEEFNAIKEKYPEAWAYIQADETLKYYNDLHLARIRYIAENPPVYLELSDEIIPITFPSYTHAAGLVKPAAAAATASAAAPFALNSRMATFGLSRAATTPIAMTYTDGENGVVLGKGVQFDPATGTGTVRLEAYTTGTKITTATTKELPADIILVLDLSNSMTGSLDGAGYQAITNGTAGEVALNYGDSEKVYVLVGDTYKEVTITGVGSETTKEIYTVYEEVTSGDKHDKTSNYDAETLYSYITGGGVLYYKASDGNYYRVTATRERNGYGQQQDYTYTFSYYNSGSSGATTTIVDDLDSDETVNSSTYTFYTKSTGTAYDSYTFSYTDANGQTVSNTYAYGDSVGFGTTPTYYVATTGNTTRAEALISATTNFASQVAIKARGTDGVLGTTDDIAHNIAIVGYSGASQSNTGVYIGSTIDTYSDGVAAATYESALQDMSTTAGVNNIVASIGVLENETGTATYTGTAMALGILAAKADETNRYVDANGNTIRTKVVIVFTDGAPNASSGNGDNAAYNEPIQDCYTMKNTYGATVYSVGILDNASVLPIPPTTDLNKYMHYMSSNYKDATSLTSPGNLTNTNYAEDGSYYLLASTANDLNNIFTAISGSATSGGSSTELSTNTEVRDIISPYFKLPEGADADDIKLYTADYTAADTWGDDEVFTPSEGEGITVNGKTIGVTGFDYSANWVGTETAADNSVTYHGKKLIVEFPFVVEPDFLGGYNVVTNGNTSGIYESQSSEGALKLFPEPDADVYVKTVVPVPDSANVYLNGDATLNAISNIGYFKYQSGVDEEGNAVYTQTTVNGVNNAYVDLVYHVYDKDGNPMYRCTVPAGWKLVDGAWVDAAGNEQTLTWYDAKGTTDTSDDTPITDVSTIVLPNLTEDDSYKVTCTVDADLDGSHADDPNFKKTSDPQIGNVNVYKPVLTFKDSTKYPYIQSTAYDTENYVSVVWMHGDTVSTDVTMQGTEPKLDLTYSPEAGPVTSLDDYYVNVTVKIFDDEKQEYKDITEDHVSFLHQDCYENEPFDKTKGEFIIHVDTGKLTVTKTVSVKPDGTLPDTIKDDQSYTITVTGGPNGFSKSVTLNKDNNWTYTFDKLVPGDYNVAEDAPSIDRTTGYRYVETKINGAVDADRTIENVEVTAGATAEVTYDNVYEQLGKLTIVKQLPNFTDAFGSYTFEITGPEGYAEIVTLGGNIGDTAEGIITGEMTYTIENIVCGDYSVSEIEYYEGDGYQYIETWYQVTGAEAAKGTAAAVAVDADGNTITFLNYYREVGRLTVIKDVDGYTDTKNFTFVVKDKDDKQVGETFTLADGDSKTLSNLPIGEYTIEEIGYEAPEHYRYLGTDVNGTAVAATDNKVVANVTVTRNATAEVTYLNKYQAIGNLEISKTVEDAANASHTIKSNQEFTFTVTFSDNGTYYYTKNGSTTTTELTSGETLTLKHGETVLFEELPAGVTYTVTEAEVTGFTADEVTKTGTIPTGDTATAAFTNTYSAALGNLTVTKKIVEQYEDDSHPGGTFNFTVSANNLTAQPGSYTIKVGGVERTVTVENGAVSFDVSITVDKGAKDNSLEITGLPAGTYTVAEKDDNPNFNSDAPKTATVVANGTGTATVTNTYPRTDGDLTIIKQIQNNSADAVPETAFQFRVSTEDTTVDLTKVLTEGNGISDISATSFVVTISASADANDLGAEQSLKISGLPSATYTVTEINVPGAFSPDFDTDPVTVTNSATVTILDNSQTVKCVNTFPVGDLTINKTVNAIPGATVPTGDNAPTFNFTVDGEAVVANKEYTVVADGAEQKIKSTADGKLEVTLKETAVIHDLELKAYRVVENVSGNDYVLVSSGEATGTVNANDTASASFTNTYVPRGDLRVSKFIDKQYPDDPKPIDTAKAFKFTVTLDQTLHANVKDDHFEFVVKTYNDGVDPTNASVVLSGKFNEEIVIDETTSETVRFDNTNGVLTFELKHNQFIEIKGLPACSYTITEADYTTEYLGPNFIYVEENPPMVIDTGKVEDVKCYNTMLRSYGNLAITKVVESNNAINELDTFEFTVNLRGLPNDLDTTTYNVVYSTTEASTGTLNGNVYTLNGTDYSLPETVTLVQGDELDNQTVGTITLNLHNGLTATIQNLPASAYTVTEKDYSAQYYGTTWTGDTGVIGNNATASAVCTNIAGMNRGNLRIDKTINKPAGITEVSNETFTVKVELDGEDVNSATYVYKLYNEADNSLVSPGNFTPGGTLQLKENQYIVIENILAGRNATVTEVIPNGASYSAKYVTNEGTVIKSGDTIDIEVVNTFVGQLTINKTVTSGDDGTFLFHVVSEANENQSGKKIEMDVLVTTSGGVGYEVIKDLPLGKYTVTENTSWSWRYELDNDDVEKGAEIEINALSKSVAFKNKQTNEKWLNEVDTVDNMFTASANS